MRIIQVIGRSNSGKTTFIRSLVRLLIRERSVATIKHLGHHPFHLEEGKDTTLFFETGVTASVGVDDGKVVTAFRDPTLAGSLTALADRDIDIAIIEGFKSVNLPAVVIGELSSSNCVVKDPFPEDMMPLLDRFPEFHTVPGITRQLRSRTKPTDLLFTLDYPLPPGLLDRGPEFQKRVRDVLDNSPGIKRYQCHVNSPLANISDSRLLVAVAGDNGEIFTRVSSLITDTVLKMQQEPQ